MLESVRRRSGWMLSAVTAALVGALAGCSSIPSGPVTSDPEAIALLDASAEAHGWDAYEELTDINVAYTGEWLDGVWRYQPTLVDRAYRESSEERLLRTPRGWLVAQHHTGPEGDSRKRVLRVPNGVRVHYDGVEETDAQSLAAAALVADAYRLFLTGPMYLKEAVATVSTARPVRLEGVVYDQFLAVIRPGLGDAVEDRVLVAVHPETKLVYRMRFTVNGLTSTRNVVAEVRLTDYRRVDGINFPSRFFERVVEPIAIDAHRWWVMGLDVNRGYNAVSIAGMSLSDEAEGKARPLPPATRDRVVMIDPLMPADRQDVGNE